MARIQSTRAREWVSALGQVRYGQVVRVLVCPRCRYPVWLENLTCDNCGTELLFDAGTLRMTPMGRSTDAGEGARTQSHRVPLVTGGPVLVPCANRSLGCNWGVAPDSGVALCYSCRLTRKHPEQGDTAALEKLGIAGRSKRRLLVGLADLGLPVVPYWVREGGLAFDLLSSQSPGAGPVVIGHASGVITIDLAESLDDYREAQRVRLDEPYRTMLGHFRHEAGHYYQWQLVEEKGGAPLEECREIFGDERASYQDALSRHYAEGAPEGWQDSYISEYATMHPWEDFAETFAHYQHILDTLTTVCNGGLRLTPDSDSPFLTREVHPRSSYAELPFNEALADWRPISHLLNRANHAMGKGDLYPFRIPEPVVHKLEFIHRVVGSARTQHPFVGVQDPVAGDPCCGRPSGATPQGAHGGCRRVSPSVHE